MSQKTENKHAHIQANKLTHSTQDHFYYMEATRLLLLESLRRNILSTKLSLFLELQTYIRNKSKI